MENILSNEIKLFEGNQIRSVWNNEKDPSVWTIFLVMKKFT